MISRVIHLTIISHRVGTRGDGFRTTYIFVIYIAYICACVLSYYFIYSSTLTKIIDEHESTKTSKHIFTLL